jgi:hypothetical protein
MAKGQAGRTYTRDSRGRFSSGGGGKAAGKASGGKQPAAKTAAKAVAPARAKATAAKPRKPAATAPRGPKPPPPPWSPAMKQAAAKAKAKKAGGAPANKIAPSPRRLNPEEKAIASVLASPKYRSDSAKRRELASRGFQVNQEQLLKGSQRVRKKLGLPIVSIGDAERKQQRAAMKRAAGEATRKRRG